MGPEDEIDVLLDFVGLYRQRQWGMLCLSALVWVFMLLGLLVIGPFALIGTAWTGSKKLVLKLRKKAADKLRPKTLFNGGNPRPTSDLVGQFVEYEAELLRGCETYGARNSLISKLAGVEEELEEYRLLSAEIRKLRVNDERPRRRDAILATHERAIRRRERREREEQE
jgi:hypothetical protein